MQAKSWHVSQPTIVKKKDRIFNESWIDGLAMTLEERNIKIYCEFNNRCAKNKTLIDQVTLCVQKNKQEVEKIEITNKINHYKIQIEL